MSAATYVVITGRGCSAETPTDLLVEDGVIAEVGTRPDPRRAPRSSTPTGWSRCPAWSTCTPTCASPGREDAETVETGTAAAALGGFTAVHAMANTDPVADTAGRRRAGLAARPRGRPLRRAARSARSPSGLAGERLAELGAMADSRRPGPGVLRRRALRVRRRADAPGAGVRQGVRRRGRPARPGAAAHRGRPDERGRALRRARACTGWPAVAEEAIIARDVLLAAHVGSRLHVCHVSTAGLGRDPALGQVEGLERHRRGDAAPPAADRRAGDDATTRCSRSTRRCATAEDVAALREALADGTIDAVATDHAPHAPEDKDCEWSAAAIGMLGLETALSVVQEAMVETGLLDWAGVADRMSVRPARIGRLDGHGQPLRGRRAGQPGAASTPPRGATVDPFALASRSRNTPYAGRTLPGAVVATFLRGRPTVLDGKLRMIGASAAGHERYAPDTPSMVCAVGVRAW